MNRRAIYFLTPPHGNLGDNAQAQCIHRMLSKFFGKKNVLEFNIPRTSEGLQQVTENDIIFMSSGGNLGDLWRGGEVKRREIIQKCHNNIIVSFPQTIAFSSKKEAKLSSDIYNAHPNLYLFARDPESYVMAKGLFPSVSVFQLPDPVFTLSHVSNVKREGILCIFRNDKEDKFLDKKDQIAKYCKSIDPLVKIIDTRATLPITEEKVTSFLDSISKYRLVVTDRFHGAIFAAITGTPCLALPTINHKITGGSYWHKKFGTKLTICEDVAEFTKQIQNIPKPFIYNPSQAIGLYHQVISSIKTTGSLSGLNPVEKVFRSRRTVRKWKRAFLPNNILLDVINAGVHAPSGSNAQCVKFRIVQDKVKITSISKEVLGRTMDDIPSVVIMVGYDFGVEGTINYQRKSPIWEQLKYQDVAAAIQNMQLYCESIGLSCCWLSFFTDKRQEFLNLIDIKDNNIEYLSGLAIGFAKSKSIFETKHSNLLVKRKDTKHYILG